MEHAGREQSPLDAVLLVGHDYILPRVTGQAAVRACLASVYMMPSAKPVEGLTLRLAVPLFDTSFTNAERRLVGGRTEVAPGVVVARLTEEESQRMRRALARPESPPQPLWRLEIHMAPLAGRGPTDAQMVSIIRRTMALLSCAVRFAPRWHMAFLDRHNGEVWVRERHLHLGAGGSERHSYVPIDRVRTWGQLLRHWSLLGLDPVVDLALDLFYDSVAERQIRPDRAFFAAVTAVDVLLGCAASPESERRIQRAAVLLLAGAKTDELAATMQSWEHARQEYLRRGISPNPELLVGLHRFLMRGLPSMARLMAMVGGYTNASAGLDVINNPPDDNHPLMADDGDRWWDYVDLDSIVRG